MAKVQVTGPAMGRDKVFAPVDFSPVRRLSLFNLIEVWWLRARERNRLARLDERMLQDIGVVRADVQWEINKPFWQP